MSKVTLSTDRRKFLIKASVSAAAISTSNMVPSMAFAENKTLTVGMNIPMTGDYAPWGLPGLYGCEIIANNINAAGGVTIGDDTYTLQVAAYDHGYDTEKAIQGFKRLVLEDEAEMVMMLGGSTVASVTPWATRKKVLTTTLLPSDITPDSKYLFATCESHPLYNVTGVEWLAKNNPDVKTAAIVDFAPIVSSILAKNPDVICMATSFYVTPIMEQLFHQGYEGKIISCTLDYYEEIIAKTSEEFVNGTIYQFPDFDDPKLTEAGINFPDPAGFYAAFIKDHPNDWSAVAWEYPAILLNWIEAAKSAGSVKTEAVAEALTSQKQDFVFGGGDWWGSQMWGLDNALVGRWPVVTIVDGKARIQEFGDVAAWLSTNKEVLVKHMQDLGLRTV